MGRTWTAIWVAVIFVMVSNTVSIAQEVGDTIHLENDIILFSKTAIDEKPVPRFMMINFIAENIRYPDVARERNIEGKVYVRYTLDEVGNVSQPSIVRSPHPVLSAEVLRLIGLMPSWTPAIKDNKPVKVVLEMPIVFRFE